MSRNWNEYELVEKKILDLLRNLNYEVRDLNQGDSLPQRSSNHEVILIERLKKALKRINPWLNDNNLNKAVNQVRPLKIKATNLMEANEMIYQKLVKHISLKQDLGKGKKNQTVKYIDFDNPANNDFLAVNQYTVKGKETIRPDIVVFINGIPISVIECKNETTCDKSEEEGINQLRRYQNVRSDELEEGAEKLFYTNQIVISAWGSSASIAGIGAQDRYFMEWKDPYPYTKEDIAELVDREPNLQDILIFSIFNKENILDLIQNFIVFEQEQNLVKMFARYQQFRAVKKAIVKIKAADSLEERNGTVWHTQGSGKSLTMLFLALKLKRMEELNNPGLLLVTDRVDLDRQIIATFERCGFPNPVSAGNVEDLRKQIKNIRGKSVMTTVQKFQLTKEEQELNENKANDEEKVKYPILNESENIFIMVDEAHRTQYKDLAFNMRRALPNACYLGFTGTPIDKESRSTLRTFGDYIDTYNINQSVEDEATLPIFYEGKLPELRVEGRDLDEIFDRVFKNKSDEEKKKIKQKYATAQAIAETPARIERICLDIIKHYESKIAPLKAQIVTVSREAAAIYKEKLDKLNGPESIVIYSGNKNDKPIIKKYHTTDEEQNQLIDRFKDPDDPIKFLIVCDKLLTGFDAPVEQVMYLDKPLKEHNLLQAIARVNRRFDEKNFGLVVDYYGVFDHLKEALAIFNNEDVENAVNPIEFEKENLERKHQKLMSLFNGLDLNNLEECVLAFEQEDDRLEFKNAFKAFSKSMDIVMPDPLAEPYRNDLKVLGKIYKAVRNRYRDKTLDVKGVGDKVKDLIDEYVRVEDISLLHEPVSILDEDKFNQVIEEKESEKAKASEMENAIKYTINQKMDENPAFYKSLKERLEEIIEKYKQGRLDFSKQVAEYREIISDINNVKSKAQKLGLSEREFALYEILKEGHKSEKKANQVKEGVAEYNTSEEPKDLVVDLSRNLMAELEEMAVVDWKKKRNKVIKPMKRMIMKRLYSYQQFKDDIDNLTTKIMQLAHNIL
ncbi:type I restriction endonuclease subunit R [Natroniella sp. ANB-PHB2]|uniref:type I restriction endonuclease subunit R n=1 Tax=Natroniella sp. ANB-PHB2 TaxID=3384444 RepID=UPI0038D4FCA7